MTADAGRASPPIACTLGAGSLVERIGEWRELVASSVDSVDADATSVRLVLDGSDSALVSAVSLAQREKQCCAFFEITVDVGPDVRTLRLSVPEGAEEALATFVAMLRQ